MAKGAMSPLCNYLPSLPPWQFAPFVPPGNLPPLPPLGNFQICPLLTICILYRLSFYNNLEKIVDIYKSTKSTKVCHPKFYYFY